MIVLLLAAVIAAAITGEALVTPLVSISEVRSASVAPVFVDLSVIPPGTPTVTPSLQSPRRHDSTSSALADITSRNGSSQRMSYCGETVAAAFEFCSVIPQRDLNWVCVRELTALAFTSTLVPLATAV